MIYYKITKFCCAHWRALVVILVPIVLIPILRENSKEAKCGYVVCIMALYWMTEVIPLPVTSLIPIVLFPFLGVLPTEKVCITYFKEPNMMFIGGLIVAIAVEHCNLHKRVALRVLLIVGTSPRRLLAGFMGTTMFLSMWISNTACTAMMVPIVVAILDELKIHEKSEGQRRLSSSAGVAKSRHDSGTFDEETRRKSCAKIDINSVINKLSKKEVCYFLSIAYAANIGGTGTLTGTGTNLAFRGLFEEIFPNAEGFNFATWMLFNVPVMIVNCVLAWIWLQILFLRKDKSRNGYGNGDQSIYELINRSYKELGPITFHEFGVALVFIFTVALWFFRKPEFMPGWGNLYDTEKFIIDDATAAILAVVLLFILPANLDFLTTDFRHQKATPSLLNWKIVHEKVPWGLVLLSGGGFAMAAATKESGLSKYLGQQLTGLQELHPTVMLIIICLITTFVTEFSSNTAIANIFLPVLAEMSVAIRINPLYLMMPATLCCSYAFMLPVATAPNAIVVAASNMKASDMMKAGLGMNFICVTALLICLISFGIPMYNLDKFPQFAEDYLIAHNESSHS